jgi:hypothetical protein
MNGLKLLAKGVSHLPLDLRVKAIDKVIEGMSDEQVNELVGENNALGARLINHYLVGSGKQVILNLKDDEWKFLINSSDGKWRPSTNKQYPASSGWEWSYAVPSVQWHIAQSENQYITDQKRAAYDAESEAMGGRPLSEYRDNQVLLRRDHQLRKKDIDRMAGTLHNALGTTTLRRRKLKNGAYQYEVAGEEFDFVNAFSGKTYGEGSERGINNSGAMLIKTLFPELVDLEDVPMAQNEMYKTKRKIYAKKDMSQLGKPFKLNASYIDESTITTEDEVINEANFIDDMFGE